MKKFLAGFLFIFIMLNYSAASAACKTYPAGHVRLSADAAAAKTSGNNAFIGQIDQSVKDMQSTMLQIAVLYGGGIVLGIILAVAVVVVIPRRKKRKAMEESYFSRYTPVYEPVSEGAATVYENPYKYTDAQKAGGVQGQNPMRIGGALVWAGIYMAAFAAAVFLTIQNTVKPGKWQGILVFLNISTVMFITFAFLFYIRRLKAFMPIFIWLNIYMSLSFFMISVYTDKYHWLMGAAIVCALTWIPYMRRSERVKRTFVYDANGSIDSKALGSHFNGTSSKAADEKQPYDSNI